MNRTISTVIFIIFLQCSFAAGIQASAEQPNDMQNTASNGQKISITNPDGTKQLCTLTVVTDSTALTAGHCGSSGAIVESSGKQIGVISENFLTSGKGIDSAKIHLNKDVHSIPKPVNYNYSPSIGDKLFMVSDFSGMTSGIITDPSLKKHFTTAHEVASTWASDISADRGDSGAPVFHQGAIIGLIQGGDLDTITLISPIQKQEL